VTALVSVLPILGSSLVWVPATAVLLLSQRPGAALALGLIGAVVSSNVDNVIRPVIYRRVSGLHPMASLLGAFAGVEMFGLIGLVLGPLAIAYCLELISLYETEYGVG
jgi:predicted PurR-regulated permease PerM